MIELPYAAQVVVRDRLIASERIYYDRAAPAELLAPATAAV